MDNWNKQAIWLKSNLVQKVSIKLIPTNEIIYIFARQIAFVLPTCKIWTGIENQLNSTLLVKPNFRVRIKRIIFAKKKDIRMFLNQYSSYVKLIL